MILVLWGASLVISLAVGYCWRAYWEARFSVYDRLVNVQEWQVPPVQEVSERAAWREYWVHHQDKLLGEFEL